MSTSEEEDPFDDARDDDIFDHDSQDDDIFEDDDPFGSSGEEGSFTEPADTPRSDEDGDIFALFGDILEPKASEGYKKIDGGVLSKIDEFIKKFSEAGGISDTKFKFLLAYTMKSKWSLDTDDIDLYGDIGIEYDDVLDDDGNEPALNPPFDGDEEGECTIMGDDYSAADMFAMPCGHYFSLDGWRGYLSRKISKPGLDCLTITCPSGSCTHTVTPDVVKKIFVPTPDVKSNGRTVFAKYLQKIVDSFVDASLDAQWCPTSSCSSAYFQPPPSLELCTSTSSSASFSDTSAFLDAAQCPFCEANWCFKCAPACLSQSMDIDDHRPATCAYAKRWRAVASDDGWKKEIAEKKKAGLIKACPKAGCGKMVEKIQEVGCKHMNCPYCNFSFCWSCLQPYSTHVRGGDQAGFYVCPEEMRLEEAAKKGNVHAQIKVGEEHAAQERVEAHRQAKEHYDAADGSIRVAKSLLKDRLEDQAAELIRNGMAAGQFVYLQTARQTLIDGVVFMKWTAVYEYYEFEIDSGERRAEQNALTLLKNSLHLSVTNLFRTLCAFPVKDILTEHNDQTCVDLKTTKSYKSKVRRQKTALVAQRTTLLQTIRDGFPAQRDKTKKEDGEGTTYARLRQKHWEFALKWLKSHRLDEYGNKAGTKYVKGSPVLDGHVATVVEEAAAARKANLWRPDWFQKLLCLELRFRLKPWVPDLIRPGPPSLKMTRSMRKKAAAIESSEKEVTFFWFWSYDPRSSKAAKDAKADSFFPFPKGESDVLEKGFRKWRTDRDELNFGKFFARISPRASNATAATKTGAPLCRNFDGTPQSCKKGSRCPFKHVAHGAKDADIKFAFSKAVTPMNLPGAEDYKVEVNYELVISEKVTASVRAYTAHVRSSGGKHEGKEVAVERRRTENVFNCNCGNWYPRTSGLCVLCCQPYDAKKDRNKRRR